MPQTAYNHPRDISLFIHTVGARACPALVSNDGRFWAGQARAPTDKYEGNIYNVDFSGSGTLAAIDVSIGQQVKKGQTLAKLSVTSLQDAVNQAQAALNAAENTLGAADNSLGSAEASGASAISVAYDQEQNALNVCNSNPSPPPRCVQLAEDQYAQGQRQADAQSATAQAQVASAYGQLQAAEAQLRTAQDNLNNATLIAPHAGVVFGLYPAVRASKLDPIEALHTE